MTLGCQFDDRTLIKRASDLTPDMRIAAMSRDGPATSMIRVGETPEAGRLLARRPFKVVAIALANKMARVAWALLAKGGTYRRPRLVAV
jgi:hypothetical protein